MSETVPNIVPQDSSITFLFRSSTLPPFSYFLTLCWCNYLTILILIFISNLVLVRFSYNCLYYNQLYDLVMKERFTISMDNDLASWLDRLCDEKYSAVEVMVLSFML